MRRRILVRDTSARCSHHGGKAGAGALERDLLEHVAHKHSRHKGRAAHVRESLVHRGRAESEVDGSFVFVDDLLETLMLWQGPPWAALPATLLASRPPSALKKKTLFSKVKLLTEAAASTKLRRLALANHSYRRPEAGSRIGLSPSGSSMRAGKRGPQKMVVALQEGPIKRISA